LTVSARTGNLAQSWYLALTAGPGPRVRWGACTALVVAGVAAIWLPRVVVPARHQRAELAADPAARPQLTGAHASAAARSGRSELARALGDQRSARTRSGNDPEE
jgi:hypothetical protein